LNPSSRGQHRNARADARSTHHDHARRREPFFTKEWRLSEIELVR
jgi:hypothetical protein